MKHIVVDIETNGSVPHLYSMVSIGAVYHEEPEQTFYAELRPMSERFQEKAYAVNGFTHEQALQFEPPVHVMRRFHEWVTAIKGDDNRIVFVSDTTAFDFSFVSYYLHYFVGECIFGHSPMSIHNLYKGATGDLRSTIYHLRDTKHTHNALQDALGNQEAFAKVLYFMEQNKKARR